VHPTASPAGPTTDDIALDGAVESVTLGPEPVRTRAGGDIALVDLLDRLLGAGVVLAGDIVISLGGVDLVQIRLHALISTVRADMTSPTPRDGGSDDG
jgi:hypothetical protein